MKIGLIARMDKTGLGIQTKAIFDHFKPHKTVVVDSTLWKEDRPEQHPEWYKDNGLDVRFTEAQITDQDADWITRDVDLVFSVETYFYNYKVLTLAKERGVKTVLQYNVEFCDYFDPYKAAVLPWPDLFLGPTEWMFEQMKQLTRMRSRLEYLPMPVDRNEVPFKLRGEGTTFLHIAGKKTHLDRNGTEIFLDAVNYVTNEEARFILHTQEEPPPIKDNRIIVRKEVKHYADLYKEGDFFVLPRKYAGLCLPLNESMSAGLVPVMTNCQPQDLFLGKINKLCLVPWETRGIFQASTAVDVYEVNPKDLGERMDMLSNLPEDTRMLLSKATNDFVEEWSWENMLPKYINLFEEICNG